MDAPEPRTTRTDASPPPSHGLPSAVANDAHKEPQPYHGLTEAEASRRLATHGPNRLPEPPLPGALTLFVRQFLSPFIYILVVAALVSFALGQIPSAVFIVAVLLVNACIGTI